jgi:hypothetical protein
MDQDELHAQFARIDRPDPRQTDVGEPRRANAREIDARDLDVVSDRRRVQLGDWRSPVVLASGAISVVLIAAVVALIIEIA